LQFGEHLHDHCHEVVLEGVREEAAWGPLVKLRE
jgi:hypothetical protein